MDEMLDKQDLKQIVGDMQKQFGEPISLEDMKWEKTPQEKATEEAIKNLKKEIKQMRSIDKVKANKLLAGLEAIECDFKAQVEIASVKLHVADAVNLDKEGVSMFEERPLITGAQDIATIKKHAEKVQKKIEKKSIKLNSEINGCRTNAQAILDAVLQNGLTPEQAVQNAMGVQVATEV